MADPEPPVTDHAFYPWREPHMDGSHTEHGSGCKLCGKPEARHWTEPPVEERDRAAAAKWLPDELPMHWPHHDPGCSCDNCLLWLSEVRESLSRLLASTRAQGRREAADTVERWLENYPEDVFPQLPPGQHGATVDACSAAALRSVLPRIAEELRREAGE